MPVLGMIASGVVFELGLLVPDAGSRWRRSPSRPALLGLCEAGFWTTVVELGHPFGGTAAGLMNTGGNAGGTLSPDLTPLLGAFFAAALGPDLGWRLSLGSPGLIVIAGAAFWWGVEEEEKAPVLDELRSTPGSVQTISTSTRNHEHGFPSIAHSDTTASQTVRHQRRVCRGFRLRPRDSLIHQVFRSPVEMAACGTSKG